MPDENDPAMRVRVLEEMLTEQGLVDPAAMDALVDLYETKIGPHIGAQVIARAWVEPEFRERLLANGSAAIAELGHGGMQGEDLIFVEDTPSVRNVIVCTLCSCYPWAVLGLPPNWYKSAPYRSRIVMDPRAVLEEFGAPVAADAEVRVWDSTAELRYAVLPQRPAGTEGWDEAALAALVTRDSMVGTGQPKAP